jgi:hypothetical protein
MARQHHFEVIVPVDDDKVYLPEMNAEDSASWPEGKVYDEEGESWSSCDDAWDDDLAAGARLAAVLDFPLKVLDIYRRHTSADGWDIDIMQEVYDLLVDLELVPGPEES